MQFFAYDPSTMMPVSGMSRLQMPQMGSQPQPMGHCTLQNPLGPLHCTLQNPTQQLLPTGHCTLQNPTLQLQLRQQYQLYDCQWQQYVSSAQTMALQPQAGVQTQQVQQQVQYAQQVTPQQMQPQWLQSYLYYQGVGDFGRPML